MSSPPRLISAEITDRRLRLALDAGRMAVWSVDASGAVEVSPEFKRLLRLPEHEDPTLETLLARYYPGELERVTKLVEEAYGNGLRFFEWEYRHLWPTDEVRWLLVRAELLRDEQGAPAGTLGVIMDITERKEAEIRRQALADLTDRFRDLEDPAEIAFAAAETLGTTLGVSRAGYGTVDPATETIAIERDWNAPGIKSLAGVLQFRDYGSYIDDLKRGETVVCVNAETDQRTAATADALKAISAQSFINMPVSEKGGFVALLYLNHETAREWSAEEQGFVREVAERTRSVIARREAELELRLLNQSLERRVDEALAERKLWADVFESSDALIGVLGPDFRILAANRPFADEFERIYGYPLRVGDDLRRQVPDESQGWVEWWQRALGGEEFVVTSDFVGPDGQQTWYELRFNTLWNRRGEVIGAFQYGVDVTERKETEARLGEAEAALRQSQKMEAMGQLTGGVAHDFNNLLTPIIGSLDLLRRKGLGGEREQRLIRGAVQSAERAKTLVQRLLAFARRQPLQVKAVHLSPLVTSMADLIASTSGPRIRLEVAVPADLPPVSADGNQVEMAILNLAVNARDAMPEGGTVSITASAQDCEPANDLGLPSGRYVRLSVADTGCGMDEATLARAIEPFFSTKGVGRGTGLGLSMVHGVAGQLGGALRIDSKPGVGTNVSLWLPIASAEPAAPEEVAETGTGLATGTVVLVDDEELVRTSTADMLSELGFAVRELASAEEALDLVEAGTPVDLVVTDHLMPGMSGSELANRLRDIAPSLPLLLVSGYAEVEGIAPDLPRLTKPFTQEELFARLQKLGIASRAR